MTEKPKKRPGRPPKPAEERGDTFSVRLLPLLRGKLEASAAQSGRSLTAEITHRLEQSYGGGERVRRLGELWTEREELHYRLRTRDLFCADLKADISTLDDEISDRELRAAAKTALQVALEKATAARKFEVERLAQVKSEIAEVTAALDRELAGEADKTK